MSAIEERKLDKPKRKSKIMQQMMKFSIHIASSYHLNIQSLFIVIFYLLYTEIPRPFPNEASITEAFGQNND